MGTTTQALCCKCGAVRTVSTREPQLASDPYSCGEGQDSSRLADAQGRGFDLGMQPYWRCLRTLACEVCGRPTRHAEIRQDDDRNYAEQQDREADVSRRELTARLSRLELAGIKVSWPDPQYPEEWPDPSTVVALYQFCHANRVWWLIELAEGVSPVELLDGLSRAERIIDRDELSLPWHDADGVHWRGRAFRAH